LNGGFRFASVCHFDKRETARLAGIPVCNNIYALHCAVLSESRVQFFLRRLVAQIADKDIGQERVFLFW
jgi:hypothetical protein